MCGSYPISAMLSSELVQANGFRQERLPHVDVLLSDRVSPQRLIGYDLPPVGRYPMPHVVQRQPDCCHRTTLVADETLVGAAGATGPPPWSVRALGGAVVSFWWAGWRGGLV